MAQDADSKTSEFLSYYFIWLFMISHVEQMIVVGMWHLQER